MKFWLLLHADCNQNAPLDNTINIDVHTADMRPIDRFDSDEPEGPFVASSRQSLDHSNLACLNANESLLTNRQLRMLSAVEYRLETWPQRFARTKDYAAAAGIALMSNWDMNHRFCHCSILNTCCHLWKFCPYCSHRRRLDLLGKYLHAFREGIWFFSTISFVGSVILDEASDLNFADYWEAINAAIRAYVTGGYAEGAAWIEELSLRSLVPVRVLPHAHILLQAPDFTKAHSDTLKHAVSEFALNPGTLFDARCDESPLSLPVSIKTYPIATQVDLAAILGYFVKPLDFVRPYRLALKTHPAWEVNQDISHFLSGHLLFTYRRQQMQCKGTLDSRSASKFIGFAKPARNSQSNRDQLASLLQECSRSRWEMHGDEFDQAANGLIIPAAQRAIEDAN